MRLNALEEAFGKIIELCPEGDLQKWQDIVDQMKEAYEQVAKKVHLKMKVDSYLRERERERDFVCSSFI